MPIENWFLLLHLAATGAMVGIIWFVQVVHYPLFARAGGNGFGWYASAHARWTGWVVGPPMVVEALTGLLLLRWLPDGIPAFTTWIGLLLILMLWASTFLVQVPYHTDLARGWNPVVLRRLIMTNWLRTLLWTARGVLVLWMLTHLM
jgi:hypothetical protein